MYFLAKIITFHVLVYATIAIKSIDLASGMNMTWTQLIPQTHKTPFNSSFELPFYDIFVDKDNHKLALLRWHNFTDGHPFGPNLTVRTHNYNGEIDTKTCNVDQPFKDDNNWVFAENVIFLKSDKVLISWRADHKTEGLRISSQIIFIDTCKLSEFINVNTEIDAKYNFVRVFHKIIRLEKSFDIIFKYNNICPNDYCKLSFDYNGEPLSMWPLPFSKSFVGKNETLYINSLFTMETNSGTRVVVTGNKNGIFYSPSNGLLISHDVYSPVLGWIKSDDLYYNHHVYSNSSGFATLCWVQTVQRKFVCKWLDGTHKNENGSEKTLVLKMEKGMDTPWISNSRDGQIIVIKPGFENKNKLIFVDKVTVDGKRERLLKITREDWPIRVELSITEQNRFFFSFITNRTESKDPYIRTYSFITKCIDIPDDTFKVYIECKKDYTWPLIHINVSGNANYAIAQKYSNML